MHEQDKHSVDGDLDSQNSSQQFELQQPTSPEVALVEPVVLSSREEQQFVFAAVCRHLLDVTVSEVVGLLRDRDVRKNDILRGVVKQIATSLGKEKEYPVTDWLAVGILDFIPENTLYEWTHLPEKPTSEQEKNYRYAHYFEQRAKK